MTNLQKLYAHPDFASLPFDEQSLLRMEVAVKDLQDNPEFQELDPQQKQLLIERIGFSPPKLEGVDPEVQQMIAQLGEKAAEGDEEALKQASNFVIRRSLYTQSVIANVVDQRIISPLMEKKFGPPEEMDELRNFALVNLPAKQEAQIADYFTYLTSQEEQIAKRTKVWSTVANVGGLIGDMAVMYGVGLGSPTSARMLGKLFTAPIQKAMSVVKSSAKIQSLNLLLNVSHAAAAGIAGVGREVLKDSLNDVIKDPTWQHIRANGKNYFMDYFIGDVIGNIALGVAAPMLKNYIKTFKGYGDVDKLRKALSETDVDGLIKQIMKLQDIDPAQAANMGAGTARNVRAAQSALEVFERINKIDPSDMPDELLGMVAQAHGKGIKKAGDGYEVWDILNPDKVSTRPTRQAAQDWLIEEIQKLTTANLSGSTKRNIFTQGAASSTARVEQTLTKNLDINQLENVDALVRLIAPKNRGRFNQEGIEAFTKAYLHSAPLGQAHLKSIRVVPKNNTFNVMYGDEVVHRITQEMVDGAGEADAVTGLVRALNDVLEKKVGVTPTSKWKLVDPQDYQEVLQRTDLYTPGWIDMVAQEKLGARLKRTEYGPGFAQPRYQLITDRGTITFNNIDEAGHFVLQKSIDEKTLAYLLEQDHGLKLVAKKDGGFQVRGMGNKLFAEAESIEQLIRQHPEYIRKLPSEFGPNATLVSPNKIQLTYTRGVAIGPYSKILEHLDNFKAVYKDDTPFKINSRGGAITVEKIGKNAKRRFDVHLTDINYRTSFNSQKEAVEFFNDGYKRFDELEKIAHLKGHRLMMIGGQYHLIGEGGVSLVASTTEDLLEKMKNLAPIPEWAPELSGLGDELLELAGKPEGNFYNAEPWEVKADGMGLIAAGKGFMSKIERLILPREAHLLKMIEKGGDQRLLQYFREMEGGVKLVNGRRRMLGQALFALADQADLSVDDITKVGRRKIVGNVLELPDIEWEDYFTRHSFTEGEKRFAHKLRDLFGRNGEGGFFTQFGLDPYDFIQNYKPRMKAYYATNLENMSDAKIEKYLGDPFGGNQQIKQHLTPFFEHARVSDVHTLVMEDDPIKFLMQYAEIGNRKLFIGRARANVIDYMKTHSESVTGDMKLAIMNYLADSDGVKTAAEIQLNNGYKIFLSKLGFSVDETTDLISGLQKMSYLSTMGFRAFLPFRNMHQIWTTLAPLVGNKYVKAGLRSVTKDKDGQLFNTLRRKGVITTGLPIFEGQHLGMDQTTLSKALKKGLKWYQNSDDFTRAVAYAAADNRFTEAVDKFRRGVIKSSDQFSDLAGLDFLPPDLKTKALLLADQGKWSQAKELFDSYVVDTTMFLYKKGVNPDSFRGVVGRMFGQFGKYPVFYVDNMRKILKYGKTSDKVAFAATLAGNVALIGAAWRQVGISPRSINPLNTMFFAGGPYYEILQNLIKVPTALSGSYKGRQAAAELFGLGQRDGKVYIDLKKSELGKLLVPGSFQLKAFREAVEEMNKGNYYRSFLAATSAPLTTEGL